MAGFANDTVYGNNADFSIAASQKGSINNGLLTNGQLWIGTTALNGGGTHINVGTLTSPNASITIGYTSPNITLQLPGGGQALQTLSDDVGTLVLPSASKNIQLVGHVVEQGSTKFSTVTAGTNLLNLNPMSSARWIVDPLGFNGTHTTIGSAITSATSGDTIFIMPGTYTENLTLKAGVSLSAYTGDVGQVIIVGKATLSTAGSVRINNITLQTNSDFLLVVSGNAASLVTLTSCNLNCTNNTGISFTSSSASAAINMFKCIGDLGTTGISYLASSSLGNTSFFYCIFTNSGGSSTATTCSAGQIISEYSFFASPLSTTSTGGMNLYYSLINSGAQNAIAGTFNGSGLGGAIHCSFIGGTNSAVSIGAAGITMTACDITSSNANSITGAGTLKYSPFSFIDTGKTINTTTQSPINFGTWTPTLTGSSTAGTTTYTVQQGVYTIIGNLVYIEANITITAATGTGNAVFGSFPFTIKNITNYAPIGTLNLASATWTWTGTGTQLFVQGNANTTNSTGISLKSTGAAQLAIQNSAASFAFGLWYQI